MPLFQSLAGHVGENVSTEILCHMLATPNFFTSFQKLFFLKIFEKPVSTQNVKLEIVSQTSFSKGRPDFICLAGDSLVIFENKLGADLSGPDQLIRYAELFTDSKQFKKYFPLVSLDEIKNFFLVLISPRRRIEASIRDSDLECRRIHKIDFLSFCNQRKIKFVQIAWEDILSDLELSDPIQFELTEFVSDFLDFEFLESEKMIMKDQEFPKALKKVFTKISSIKSQFALDGFETTKIASSYNYMGFSIFHQDLQFWFGYFLTLWENCSTPVFLQVREGWIKNRREEILKKMQGSSFFQDKKEGFVLPFSIDSISEWKTILDQNLFEITNTS